MSKFVSSLLNKMFSLHNWWRSIPLKSIINGLGYRKVGFQAGVQAETACEQGPSSLQDQLCGGTDSEPLTAQACKRQERCVEHHFLDVLVRCLCDQQNSPFYRYQCEMRLVVQTGTLGIPWSLRGTQPDETSASTEVSMSAYHKSDLMVDVKREQVLRL